MQFIGVHDNKGNEIFENDIIKTTGYIGVVKYSNQACQFQIQWTLAGNRYMPLNVTFGDDTGYFQCDYMEVIGNIYKNPELIK